MCPEDDLRARRMIQNPLHVGGHAGVAGDLVGTHLHALQRRRARSGWPTRCRAAACRFANCSREACRCSTTPAHSADAIFGIDGLRSTGTAMCEMRGSAFRRAPPDRRAAGIGWGRSGKALEGGAFEAEIVGVARCKACRRSPLEGRRTRPFRSRQGAVRNRWQWHWPARRVPIRSAASRWCPSGRRPPNWRTRPVESFGVGAPPKAGVPGDVLGLDVSAETDGLAQGRLDRERAARRAEGACEAARAPARVRKHGPGWARNPDRPWPRSRGQSVGHVGRLHVEASELHASFAGLVELAHPQDHVQHFLGVPGPEVHALDQLPGSPLPLRTKSFSR